MNAKVKAIIGLGNPGAKHYFNRHSIGFRVLDYIADQLHVQWNQKERADIAYGELHNQEYMLIKPQTFMNASGKAISLVLKKGIKPEEMLVVHDEIEISFGQLKIKFGGSAKGHNGLRSIIEVIGKDFYRLAFGVGRPAQREDVPDYVLSNFTQAEEKEIPVLLHECFELIFDKKLI